MTTEPTIDTPELPPSAEAEPDDAATVPPEVAAEPEEEPTTNRREARYRRQLRDTEAERDQLAQQLEALRRDSAEAIARRTIAEPAGLWAAGVTVEALLAEDGTVDADKVTAAAEDARTRLGLAAAPRRGLVVPSEGSSPRPTPTPSFEDAFAPR